MSVVKIKINNLSSQNGNVFRVRKWGDPIMVGQAGLSTLLVGTTNFQATGLYNKSTQEFGGVSHFLRIPQADVKKLAAMQVEDDFVDKKDGWSTQYGMEVWRVQKMNWLCKSKGTIYFYFHHASEGHWSNLSYIEWGTIALGWNYVTVEDVETLIVRVPEERIPRKREMARLAGFRQSDWDRPLQELLACGLVHRCYCAYWGDDIGDSPKGIVYSPFWSPRDWQFIGQGQAQPSNFYIPMDWLIRD